MNYFLPILLIIVSNTFYNISAKATPTAANPFLSLFFTYLTATALTAVAVLFTGLQKPIGAAVADLNWAAFGMAAAIVGLELGYILAYRLGMPISQGTLYANIGLAVVLVVIGVAFYKENFGFNQGIGIALCLLGLFFLNRP